MSEANGDDFMAEMAAFLRPVDGDKDSTFQRPSGSLKLKKEKKEKKKKKGKSSGSDSDDGDNWVDSSEIIQKQTESWLGVDQGKICV